MSGHRSPSDPVLDDVIAARSVAARRRAVLEVLTTYAVPVVQRLLDEAVVRGELSVSDVQDLNSELSLRVMRKLTRLGEEPASTPPIPRLADYVAVSVRNAIEDLRRERDPWRTRLALRIRYVLTHTAGLSLWGRDPALGGLTEWQRDARVVSESPCVIRAPLWRGSSPLEFRRLLREFLERTGAPLRFDDIVDAFAASESLPPRPFVPLDALSRQRHEDAPLARLEGRQYLETLWREIGSLPLRQRRALLLQLRLDDGESVARQLPVLGIADLRTLAATLEMPLPELVSLWPQLPLPDQRIADMLSVTRQQVINLRKSARERLARRMRRPRRP
jgi:hypothetical protein